MAQSGLQGMVMRVGVGREILKIHRIYAQIGHPRRGVLCGGIHDGAGSRPAPTGVGDSHRMLGRCQPGLIVIDGRAQPRAFSPNVGEFRKPVSANLALNAEVPLLGCAYDPVQWNHEFDRALNRPRKTGRALLEQGK